MRKNLHKISLFLGLFLLLIGTVQSQNGDLILTTPDLSTWTCEVGEVQTFIWKYNYTLDGYDKECDDIDPSSIDLSIDEASTIEIVGGPSVSGCFVSLNFQCVTDAPLDLKICVNAADFFQASDDAVGCYQLSDSMNESNEEDSDNEDDGHEDNDDDNDDDDDDEDEDNNDNDNDGDDQDSDNDGIVDSEDCAPNDPNASSRYDACDDGDANTVNDQYDSNCNCRGETTVDIDSDNDGVIDSEDCAPNDPNASGRFDSCDDGDASTVNDQYDSNCNCRGRSGDSDNDGVADSEDCAPFDPDASSRFDACDDGDPMTINDQYDSNCNCRGQAGDSDNDGVIDSEDCAPNDPNASSRYDACDDGNANTVNDQYDSNCNCRGQEMVAQVDSDNDGVFDGEDCAPNDPNASSRYDACDDGDDNTVNDQYDSNCNCRGQALDTDNDGVPDSEDCAPNDPNASSRFDACDDGDASTVNDQYDSLCRCRGEVENTSDSDGDGVIDEEDCAPNDPNASSRYDTCDDGNANTVNDQYDSNCNCRGQEETTTTIGSSESVVFFDLDACFSTSVSGENDYSEFEASYPNTLDCATFSSSALHRSNPNLNRHSCTPGAGGTAAMCVSASIDCDYSKTSDQALVFEVQVDVTDMVSITGFKFLEKAPEQFDWINGASGPNNYPTLYGVRVLVDGDEVYFEDNISTTTEWTEESFSFDDILIDANSTVVIEMLAYCPVGNGATASVWDVENVELLAACGSSSALISMSDESMKNTQVNSVSSSAKSLAVYPNPFSTELFVNFDLEVQQEVTIEIFDLSGRKLYSYSNEFAAGENTVKLDDIPSMISTSLLISRVSIGDKVYTNKIMQMPN